MRPNDIVRSARAVATEVSERSQEIEAAGTLPVDLVERFRDKRLFDMALPVALGGLECPPLTVLEVVEEMSRADPSAGWTLLIGQGSGLFAWLPSDIAKEMVARTPHPIVASSMAPTGAGRPTPDGYLVSGRWPFVSGCSHSDWITAGFIVADDKEATGPPARRMGFFAATEAKILDTWHVAGLRGTGSHDIAAQEIVVPREWTFDPWSEPAHEPGPLYAASMMSFLMMMIAGFPIGVARRALDEFHATAHRKTKQPSGTSMAEEPLVQVAVLRCESALSAARALLVDTVGLVEDAVRADGVAPLPLRARLAAAVVQSMAVARDVVDTAFHSCGASALYASHPLQRCFRDIHAAGQHIVFGQETLKRLGRVELGLAVPAFLV